MAAGDDGDWGDFVINRTTLSHNLSRPKPTIPTHRNLEPTQSASALCRVSTGTPFQKSSGALPLSLFGDIDEEHEEGEEVQSSGGEAPSLGITGTSLFAHKNVNDSKKNKKDEALSVNVDDFDCNLYRKNSPLNGLASNFERWNSEPRGLDPAGELNHMELSMNSDWNWADQNLNDDNVRE